MTPDDMRVRAEQLVGTDREFSALFDRESSTTRVKRPVSGEVGAHVSVTRHAVKCAEQRRTCDGA
jgi:hypothetical protein